MVVKRAPCLGPPLRDKGAPVLRAGLVGGGAPNETHTDGRWPILYGSTLGAVGISSLSGHHDAAG
jgi:hypothetical protein